MMKEGDTLFECGIGRSEEGFLWHARGHGLEEFCRTREPDWPPLDAEGWLNVGPFKTKKAAEQNLKNFEDDFVEFLQEKFPELEIKKIPPIRVH
jgi:hypothetical protein